MLKTKCGCGARYEYTKDEGGTSVRCDCGNAVYLPPAPSKPPGTMSMPWIVSGCIVAAVISGALVIGVISRGTQKPVDKSLPPASVTAKPAAPLAAAAAPMPAVAPAPKPVPATAVKPAPPPKPRIDTLDAPKSLVSALDGYVMGETTQWSLMAMDDGKKEEYTPLKEITSAVLTDFLPKDHELTKVVVDGNQAAAVELLDRARLYSSATGFFKNKPALRVHRDEDNKLCAVVVTLCLDTEFNTLRVGERARASRVFQENASKALARMAGQLKALGLQRLALGITYGQRDFSGPNWNHDGESLVVIAEVGDMEAYEAKKMTQDAFLEKCSVFLTGKDYQTKKIALKLE